MAIGAKKRLERLVIVSIIVNCTIVCLQLFYKNEQGVKSKIEISRTVNSYDHGEFMHHVRVDENSDDRDGKESQTRVMGNLESRDDNTNNLHVQEETRRGEIPRGGIYFDSFAERRCPEGGEALGMLYTIYLRVFIIQNVAIVLSYRNSAQSWGRANYDEGKTIR